MIFTPASIGVVKAAANWWFAHNVLGLWFTPIGLATAYYLIPKVLGRPVHSYHLSLLGFWTLAIFYNWAGTHHLIGGPLPAWLVTVGIVGSMMMFVPVITVAVNHHLTMVGNFGKLKVSPTLRFVVFGAMSYTAVSVQGSLTSLRTINETTHFTHYTIAHAHLGVYAFFSMMMFGAMYYIMPRLLNSEWHSARLIRVHFWTTAAGIAFYWIGLTWGGVIQGLMMNNPDIPFLDIVAKMNPYLHSRSVAGVLMTIGHISFAVLVWKMIRRQGALLRGPTLLSERPAPSPREATP
jgi:cytochrome c oxidase cbb3-type subunit 1